ncbi:cell wall-binding protein [Bacillus paramycoides]|uniref:cell wall-binding protein n=1 Tax=Bacillus paramycoides TaxID=2026194 RepID=UPI00405A2BD9
MNGKSKKGMRKVLPVGLAMGVLFSGIPLATPLTEHKVKADVDTVATVITTLGSIYNAFAAEAFGQWLEDVNAETSYDNFYENITYMAPTFQKGEFGISAFDYYKNQNFSKRVKLAYPDGTTEYKTIKHGEQIRIKQAGTIVDLTPDEPELSKHDILYITQKQLDEGNTGVSLTNFKTYYLQSDNSSRRNDLGYKYLKQRFPNAYNNGIRVPGVDENELFKKLPAEKQMLGTSTSKTVSKDVVSNYATNDPEAVKDLNKRLPDILGNANSNILETSIQLPFITVDHGNQHQIISFKKGTNKVFIRKGSKYLSAKGGQLQYSDSIGEDELFELVQIENSYENKFQFRLNDKNGVSLAGNLNAYSFGRDSTFRSEITFPNKSNEEISNWLSRWYPGKENEKQKYDGVSFKDGRAYDSSGNLIKNSWVNKYDTYAYANSNGDLLKGWQEIEGNTYYFLDNGDLVKKGSSSSMIDGKYYHFDDKGALQRSAWEEDHYGLGYSDDSGAFVNGLKEIDGKIYYFKDFLATTKQIRLEDQNVILHFSNKGVLERASKLDESRPGAEVNFDNKQLMFERDGSIRKSGVSKIHLPGLNFDKKEEPVLVYYSLEEGRYYTGWKEVDGKKYYFENGNNYNLNRNQTIDGKKYYINQDGQVLPTGFVDVKYQKGHYTYTKTYYYNDKGEMQTGIQTINGEKYFFSEESGTLGEMYKYRFFPGKRYFAGTDGKPLRSPAGGGQLAVTDESNDLSYDIWTNDDGSIYAANRKK